MVIVIQLPILVIFSSLVMVNLRMEEMISLLHPPTQTGSGFFLLGASVIFLFKLPTFIAVSFPTPGLETSSSSPKITNSKKKRSKLGLVPDPSYLNTTSNVCISSLFQNAFRIFIFYPLYTNLPRYTWESPPSQHHSSFS